MNAYCQPEVANSATDSSMIEPQAIDPDNEENMSNTNTAWSRDVDGFDVEVRRTERTKRTTITYSTGRASPERHDETRVDDRDSNMEDGDLSNDNHRLCAHDDDNRLHGSCEDDDNLADDDEQVGGEHGGTQPVAQITVEQEEITRVSKLHITPCCRSVSSENKSTAHHTLPLYHDTHDDTCREAGAGEVPSARCSPCANHREASHARSATAGRASFNPSFYFPGVRESSMNRPSSSFRDVMGDNSNNHADRDTRATTTFTRGSHSLSMSSNSLHRTSVVDHASSPASARTNRCVEPGEVVFVGPGPAPSCYNPSFMKLHRCFDRRNGLLFRIEDARHHTWAFYNDTRNYMMHVTAVFGRESMVRALGETIQETLDADSGRCTLKLTIPPSTTLMFMKGECNGFGTRYDAKPVRRNIRSSQPRDEA